MSKFITQALGKLGAENPKRYLKSAGWLTAGRFFSMLVSLLTTFYVARTLGPQNFGELSYAQSIFGILALFGSSAGVIYRDLVKYPEQEKVLLGTAWTVSFVTALLTCAMVIGYVLLIPHDTLTIMVLGIICLTQFFSPFYLIQNVFYAKTETKWLAITNLGIHVAISVTKIAAMIMGQGVLVLAAIMVLEHILASVCYIVLYLKLHKGSLLSWSFKMSYAKNLILDSLPLVIIAASSSISSRVDQVFIKLYIDTATVGLYSVATQLSEIWQFLPGILLTAIFPAVVNARLSALIYRRRLLAITGTLLAYGIGLSLLLTIFAPLIVELIYGPAFSGSVLLLQIYCWSIAGTVIGFAVGQYLVTENLRQVQILTAVLPMVVNVALNMIMIPHLGAAGAAIATVISYSLAPLIPFFFYSARQPLKIAK